MRFCVHSPLTGGVDARISLSIQLSQFAIEFTCEPLDSSNPADYLSECTEHGAPEVEGSPARQSLRRMSIG